MANTNYEFIYTVEDYSGITTSVVMSAGQTRWFDTVTGLDADRVINLIGDGASTVAELLVDYKANVAVDFPIGYVYWQLPGKDSPADMSFTGTWSNVSSTFAGDFFRAEGGSASAFEAGEQADAMQKITGKTTAGATVTSLYDQSPTQSGIFSHTADNETLANRVQSVSSTGGSNLTFDSSASTSPNAAKTDDVETRPVNHTIRLWERTA